jgi:hypothetical protein
MMWQRLLAEEFDWDKPVFKKIAFAIICITSVTIPLGMFAYFHLLDYLGPGLGDHTSFDYIRNEFQALKASGNDTTAIALGQRYAIAVCLSLLGHVAWLHQLPKNQRNLSQ